MALTRSFPCDARVKVDSVGSRARTQRTVEGALLDDGTLHPVTESKAVERRS